MCRTSFGIPRRTAAGTDFNRVNLLLAVLEKRLGLSISNCDAYINIAGGLRITEPAIDLGVVMAVVSSFKNRPIEDKLVAFGEIGLSGEVRAVNMAENRVAEAKKLGFTTCIVPQSCVDACKKIEGIKILGVSSVQDAMEYI